MTIHKADTIKKMTFQIVNISEMMTIVKKAERKQCFFS